jgi:hypothetical protein
MSFLLFLHSTFFLHLLYPQTRSVIWLHASASIGTGLGMGFEQSFYLDSDTVNHSEDDFNIFNQ